MSRKFALSLVLMLFCTSAFGYDFWEISVGRGDHADLAQLSFSGLAAILVGLVGIVGYSKKRRKQTIWTKKVGG